MRALPLICATALACAAAVPAVAQPGPYVDEVVVTGPVGPDGPRRLSQRVSYADLDLATYAGQEVLRVRIRDTAKSLCRALGEDNTAASPLVPSCETQAVRDARTQVRRATGVALAEAGRRTYYAYADDLPY